MKTFDPIDYLVFGHLTKDIIPTGWKLGGTAAYSALTARALGCKVGIITVGSFDLPIPELPGIQISLAPDAHSTTFENIQMPEGRLQFLHQKANVITQEMIPEEWQKAPIVHLGPIMQEVSINILEGITAELICLTPQGWLRTTEPNTKVVPCPWKDSQTALQLADITIMSNEDVGYDESIITSYKNQAKTLVITEGFAGSRVYHLGEYQYFHAPEQAQKDPTGAGDIYAACFFIKYKQTRNPWLAADFATQMAANSVTRFGLEAVPNAEEIRNYDIKIDKVM